MAKKGLPGDQENPNLALPGSAAVSQGFVFSYSIYFY
jgi:hypothetical protein